MIYILSSASLLHCQGDTGVLVQAKRLESVANDEVLFAGNEDRWQGEEGQALER